MSMNHSHPTPMRRSGDKYRRFQEAQAHEKNSLWREARVAYAEAGADASAKKMHLREIEDEFLDQLIRGATKNEEAHAHE